MPPPRLPSGQESPPWDLTSEPAVTYKPSHGSRSISYEQMADDEDSLEDSIDSSTSAASSHGIQGTFPSSDRIRIRWAQPMNRNQGLGVLADGRRRVGVEDSVGSLHCTILGRDEHERIKMRLEYEGTCKALWFPGVATQVGLDVVLDAKGRTISWASEDERWEISGGPGLTGYDGIVPVPSQATPRASDETESHIPRPSLTSTRLSSYGAPSLLQTALPTNSILPDYSFETTPSPTVSMINSTGTPYGNSSTSSAVVLAVAPTKPITLFLDIGDLSPPPSNEFNFKASGTILVGPHKDSDEKDDDEEIELPIFRILPAAKTRSQLLISSEMQQGIEVILPQEKRQLKNGMVNGIRTPPPRRKTLKRKSTIQADDGVCIIIPTQPLSPEQSPAARLRTTPRTPQRALSLRTQRTPRTPGSTLISSPVVGGPHSIPWVRASVTLLPPSNRHSHAVQFSVPAVAVTDGVLSFGVCPPSFVPHGDEPAIEIVSATADGMSLQVEVITRASLEDEKMGDGRGFPFVDFTTASGELKKEEMSDLAIRDMDTWIRIVLPDERIFGNLDIQYLVARDPKTKNQKKSSSRSENLLILLPAFHIGVGTYAVDFHHSQG
ncbi:9594_t:CDS:1, partial [Acaulospora colombiana]